jgi:hypothetical protein
VLVAGRADKDDGQVGVPIGNELGDDDSHVIPVSDATDQSVMPAAIRTEGFM